MKENIFNLDDRQLNEIAGSLYDKVLKGLEQDNTQIQCIPTYITPKIGGVDGKALVLDLGGTNYRAAVVDFSEKNKPVIRPENGWRKDLSIMKTEGYRREQLFMELADLIGEIQEKELPVGYCFSYPAESMLNGDAKLIRWTKGVNIKEMIGEPVGETLLDYLNCLNKTRYTSVRVVNDTVASLFAGLSSNDCDAYIGLIVGTGTNMATFIPAEKIPKLDPAYCKTGLIPVNLESGNFHPSYLTSIDDLVDGYSDNQGNQRFEKAVSGMYLGEILKTAFPDISFEDNFDARKLTSMLSYPDIYKEEYVQVARCIYQRSAHLVAASIAGLIKVMKGFDNTVKRICITAEGSLFWSEDTHKKNYKNLVTEKLYDLLRMEGLPDVSVDIRKMDNANLIGSALAALS